MKKLLPITLAIFGLSTGCTTQEKDFNFTRLSVHLNDTTNVNLQISINSHQDHYTLSVHNASEIIESKPFNNFTNDTVRFPYFEKYLVFQDKENANGGIFVDPNKENYTIPFTLSTTAVTQPTATNTTSNYAIRFSPNTEDEYPGLLILNTYGNHLTATVLTETGDYRYLQGEKKENKFELNCFDGAHLFHFNGTFSGDSIQSATFYSGKHWSETFNGALTEENSLKDPYSLTTTTTPFKSISGIQLDGTSDSITLSTFKQNPLTIIQIMGTWCPNCLDENKYYIELKNKYPDLQIITLAYEIQKDQNEALKRIQDYKTELGIPWKILYGGRASKSLSSSHFSFLNKVISYPTSVFINSEGEILKVHTGFYGPGTGHHYTDYKENIETLLDSIFK